MGTLGKQRVCPQAAGEKLARKQSSRSPGFGLGVRSENPCEEEPLPSSMHVPRKYGLVETRAYPTRHRNPSAVSFGGIF